jgi:ubiquinone biosynthesis protein UbiJ
VTAANYGVLALLTATLFLGCGKAPDLTANFCEAVVDLKKIDRLSLAVSPSDDPAVRGALAQTAAQTARVAREAPIEIRGDAEVVAAFVSALTRAFNDTEFSERLERSAAIGAAQQQFEVQLAESIENLSAFVARTCTPAPN